MYSKKPLTCLVKHNSNSPLYKHCAKYKDNVQLNAEIERITKEQNKYNINDIIDYAQALFLSTDNAMKRKLTTSHISRTIKRRNLIHYVYDLCDDVVKDYNGLIISHFPNHKNIHETNKELLDAITKQKNCYSNYKCSNATKSMDYIKQYIDNVYYRIYGNESKLSHNTQRKSVPMYIKQHIPGTSKSIQSHNTRKLPRKTGLIDSECLHLGCTLLGLFHARISVLQKTHFKQPFSSNENHEKSYTYTYSKMKPHVVPLLFGELITDFIDPKIARGTLNRERMNQFKMISFTKNITNKLSTHSNSVTGIEGVVKMYSKWLYYYVKRKKVKKKINVRLTMTRKKILANKNAIPKGAGGYT